MVNPYLPNDTKEIKQKLLKTIDINKVEELFADIDPAILKPFIILRLGLGPEGPFPISHLRT